MNANIAPKIHGRAKRPPGHNHLGERYLPAHHIGILGDDFPSILTPSQCLSVHPAAHSRK